MDTSFEYATQFQVFNKKKCCKKDHKKKSQNLKIVSLKPKKYKIVHSYLFSLQQPNLAFVKEKVVQSSKLGSCLPFFRENVTWVECRVIEL